MKTKRHETILTIQLNNSAYFSCFWVVSIQLRAFELTTVKWNLWFIGSSWVMINCSKFVCSKNLLDTILLLLDSIRAIIIFLVNWSTAVLNLLSCRINWIRAIDINCVNRSNCRPLYIRTVDTNIKTDINFALIAIARTRTAGISIENGVHVWQLG